MMQQPEELKLFDIYTIWYKPFWDQPWFLISAIVVMLCFICVGLYILYKRYIYKPIVIPCDQAALYNLDIIEKSEFKETHDFKQGYFELTLIVKKYLSKRYSVDLTGLTDTEVVVKLKDIVPEEIILLIKHLVQAITLVKFADQQAVEKKFKDDIEAVKKIVMKTRPTIEHKG